MKKASLRGGFFCEACNNPSASKFCMDCGNKCIEATSPTAPSPALASPAPKKVFCIECGLPATTNVRFCTGCGTSLAGLASPAPAVNNAVAEEEKKRKQQEEQKAREQELQRAREEQIKREAAQKAAEAEAKRQEEEARARLKAEEERKRQADEIKRNEEALRATQAATQQRKPQSSIRFCIECGYKSTIANAKFCVQCGKTFDDLPATPAASIPAPIVAAPPLPAIARSLPPPTAAAPRIGTGRKPVQSATLRGPIRPPCRKCGAPTGPRFCTACGEKTDEELERLRLAAAPADVPVERNRGQTTVLRAELSNAQKELERKAEEAARNEARANALQAQLEELKRQQELQMNGGPPPEAPEGPPPTPSAPPPPAAPEIEFAPSNHSPKPLKPSAASLHDQLKTATLKKAVVVQRPKATSTADGRLRGATFLGAMQRIQAATSKDIDDDDDGDWDGD